MAFEKGTATNHKDLLEKLVAFLTTNPALVAAGQQYDVVFDQTMPFTGQTAVRPDRRHVVFRGRGLSGLDQIYTSVSEVADTAADYYNWSIGAGIGFLPSSLIAGYGDLRGAMIGGCPQNKSALLWDQPMTYWFFANGRRWFMVAKVSTTYASAGAGFILPPCPPAEYRYPCAIWGSADSPTARWSVTTNENWGMTCGSAWLRDPGGNWAQHRGTNGSGSNTHLLLPMGCNGFNYVSPTGSNSINNQSTFTYNAFVEMRNGPDGSFPLWPVTLISTTASGSVTQQNTFGEADGLFWVPSLNNGSEDEIVVNGVPHILFQSVFRAGNPYMFALRAN